MTPMAEVTIRPQQIKDASEFYRILTSGDFAFFPVNVASIEAEKRFLRKSVAEFKLKQNYNFTILLGGKLVGAVGIMPEPSRPYNAEIGYFIDSSFHGQGIAFKAAILAENYVRVNLEKIHRLQAFIVTKNQASVRVVEKAGYNCEGTLKKYLKVGDAYHDAYIFAKIVR